MAITLEDITKFDNGARFYLADLHVHTYGASKCVQDSQMTPETILRIADQKGISILAITDHNCHKNIDCALDCSQKYLGRILLLPGVEISTAHGHLLVLFPPNKSEAVSQLLARIKLVGAPGDQECHTAMSMADVLNEAKNLGGVSIGAHIDRIKSGFDAIVQGFPPWKRDILTNDGLYGVEVDEGSHLDWYSDRDENNAAGAERIKIIRARESAVPGRMGFARIQGSDAHTIADFEQCIDCKRVTRFKMNDLSFEAFKTALVDSDARVRAVASVPKSVPKIVGMCLSGGFLDKQKYHLNSNLNCFIGGRGTGKSTALQSLAYGLGVKDDFAEQDNCPDNIIVYCENTNGILFRYDRDRGGEVSVKAKEKQEISEVPPDVFTIEYYGQGELTEVAKDPLKNPLLLQKFLDRHIRLEDLQAKEQSLITSLNENSSLLLPLYAAVNQLADKKERLKDIDKKLQVAEQGKLKEVVNMQLALATEKQFLGRVVEARDFYKSGISFTHFIKQFSGLVTAQEMMGARQEIRTSLQEIQTLIESSNSYFEKMKAEITEKMATIAAGLDPRISTIKGHIEKKDKEILTKMAEFRSKGLSGDLQEIDRLLKERKTIIAEIENLEKKQMRLNELNSERRELKSSLGSVRDETIKRRKSQLKPINDSLSALIQEYTVFLHYENSGILDDFKNFIQEIMQGSYFGEEGAQQFCSKISPQKLSDLVISNDCKGVAVEGGLSDNWASEVVSRIRKKGWAAIHELETIWKPPMPVIGVRLKSGNRQQISVTQLSDGQKHTILLTIAMLSESNCPLLIDQPEDDLDNAFIFDCVVSTLRKIKECRQVILVTHNANIAVLGDAELLFPMKRDGDTGVTFNFGSIDRTETKLAAQNILEGGEMAFKRRKEIYGY